MSDSVVYINLTNTPIAITNERGGSVTLRANEAVKGEYFARWAQPKGPLSMMHENHVSPSAVIYAALPSFDIDEQRWDEVKKKVDPILFAPDPVSLLEVTIKEALEELVESEIAGVISTETDIKAGDRVFKEGEIISAFAEDIKPPIISLDTPAPEAPAITQTEEDKTTRKKRRK